MASLGTIISENVQQHLTKANWNAAITEMERLFAIHRDPLIRVRIGDMRRKLDREHEAIGEYLLAANLFAEDGFVRKALAQYRLALQLDPENAAVRSRMERLRMSAPVARPQRGPVEYRVPDAGGAALPAGSPARDSLRSAAIPLGGS
jgi:tetratricopeptide (TPR) repeat protein